MSLAEHKKDGWTNQQPVAGAAAAAAYTGGQAEFTKALLASEHAYGWQCIWVASTHMGGFHAYGWLPRIRTSWTLVTRRVS